MALIGETWANDGLLKGNGIVATVMSNLGLERFLGSKGLGLERTKVGDRYVLEELEKHGWILGGEGSGHLLALDRHSTGDGVISALSVLAACTRAGRSLAQLLSDLTLFPQVLINVRIAPDCDWQSNSQAQQLLRDVEAELGDSGRVLVRASGTEPLLRVMVEARDHQVAARCAQRLAQTLEV
jgi:phosphoglucosamine mutase